MLRVGIKDEEGGPAIKFSINQRISVGGDVQNIS